MSTIDILFLSAVGFAAVYWLIATASVVGFGRRRVAAGWVSPPVSVLKPLRGDDGYLYTNLRSFCRQDYPRFEILFGVRDRHDPAVAVVERLMREFPDLRLKLIVDNRAIGSNPKVSNLANLVRHAKHDTLILADSDMRVEAGYIRTVVAPLEDPSVGLVTCLYRGIAPSGIASRLGAMFINEWFVPSALVATHIEPLRHAFGATIACRRETLSSIGGFEVLADHLADDYMLGWLVSRRRLRVVLVPYVVENVVHEPNVLALVLHELRWARTFRTLRPVSYFFSLFTYGIPLSLLWLIAGATPALASVAAGAHVALRCASRIVLYRSLGQPVPWSDTWLVPIRDLASFTLGILSFFGRTVRWKNEAFHVRPDGCLERRDAAISALRLHRSADTASLASKRETPA